MAINLAGPGKPTKARPALHSLCQEGRVGCIKGVWRPRSLPLLPKSSRAAAKSADRRQLDSCPCTHVKS